VFSLYVLYVVLNPIDDTVPDNKGFIPVNISIENDIHNITLPIGSNTILSITLTSNLDFDVTITVTPTLVALGEREWFSAKLDPNPICLEPFGTNSTMLTINLSEDTPVNIQPDTLWLEMESEQYPSVRLWNGWLNIFVD
jgi:hypothetical protein